MDQTIYFEFECFNLPGTNFEETSNLRLGIQEDQETIMDVPTDSLVAYFHFFLKVKQDPETGKPVFKGLFAHGPRDRQFIYLSWGTRDEQGKWKVLRRLKIPLYTLSWETIQNYVQSGSSVRTRIRMTDRKGEPASGTINQEDIEWL